MSVAGKPTSLTSADLSISSSLDRIWDARSSVDEKALNDVAAHGVERGNIAAMGRAPWRGRRHLHKTEPQPWRADVFGRLLVPRNVDAWVSNEERVASGHGDSFSEYFLVFRHEFLCNAVPSKLG